MIQKKTKPNTLNKLLFVTGICVGAMNFASPIWAQSATHTPSAPVENARKGVIRVDPSHLPKTLKSLSHELRPTVVHFSSTDGSCLHCEKNNESFEKAYRALSADFNFVETAFNPWRQYLGKYKRLGGLPAVEIYEGVVPIAKISGFKEDLTLQISEAHKKTSKLLGDDYSDVEIAPLTGAELSAYIEKLNSDNLIVLHLTSTNKVSCQFCVINNSFFRAAGRKYSNQFQFAEVSYDTMGDFKADTALHDWLKTQKIVTTGLPVTLFYDKGKFLGKRNGVWPSMPEDLSALEKR